MTTAPVVAEVQAFAAVLPPRGRLVGLDVGEKTIGLAACDAGRMIATPDSTIARSRWTRDLDGVRAFLRRLDGACGLVIGLPLSLDGSDSPRTQSVRATARNLAAALDLPVLLWDERWSTMAVERAMIDADVSRAKRAARVDAAAAGWILQGAIDALRRQT